MKNSHRIRLLEDRLNRLEAKDRNNFGICRKIRREIDNLRRNDSCAPLVVVGAMVNGKPNYVLVGHLGIIGHDRIMVSLAKPHYTDQGIRETRALTVNIVDEAMLKKADRTGCVSGNKVDKSDMFAFHMLDLRRMCT